MKAKLFLIISIFLFIPYVVYGATITATSCSLNAVKSAYNSATDGDIVRVPAGSCTWSSDFTISKGITLQGAGVGNTNINFNNGIVYLSTSQGKSYRITGFTITGNSGSNGIFRVSGTSKSWRFDHNRIQGSSSVIRGGGATYGVIDHNDFMDCDMCIRPGHATWGGHDWGDGSWADDLYFGTEKAIFIEDNNFINNGQDINAPFDCEEGGRIVFRNNYGLNQFLINHGTDSSGRLRSCFSMEIYGNTLEDTNYWFTCMQFRGGTAVIYDNDVSGDYDYFADLYNRRSESPWGSCNGNKIYDGNQESNGYPCLDQMGRSTGGLLTSTNQPWPNQKLEPAYFWDNTFNGNSNVRVDGDGWIKENRDFYNGVERPGYTPYVYPHPLVSGTPEPTCTQLSGSCCTGNLVCTGGSQSTSDCSICCISGECEVQQTCNDNDGDGYGSPASSSCPQPSLDCNDNDASVNPGETEICGNGKDDDCSGGDAICPPQTCNDLGGSCCSGSQTCSGQSQSTSDCQSCCLSGTCQLQQTCSQLDGSCCQAGTSCSGSSAQASDCSQCCISGSCQVVSNPIIPADRILDWNPGIPGGIPARTTICANVKTDYGATGNGNTDDTNAIQQAINNCPEGQVVFIPQGTYRTSGISINKGITLRGAGSDKTKIENPTSSRAIISIGTWGSYGTAVSVNSGSIKGSNQITVSNSNGFNVGDIIEIDQENDPNLVSLTGAGDACTWGGRNSNSRAMGQIVEITGKNGNTLTISPALHYDYSPSFNPEIVHLPTSNVVKNAGVEDLQIERTTQGGQFNIEVQSAAYIWIKGVESSKVQGRHISLGDCLRCEIRDCLVHEAFDYNSGANAYGILLASKTSDSLIENCITYTLNGGTSLESSGPGNVIAYNYFEDAINAQNMEWMIPDIGNHCAHPWGALYEQNRGSMISADAEHGGSSHLVYFRNYVDMERLRSTSQNKIGILFWAYSRYMTVVGNIIAQQGMSGEYEAEGSTCSAGTRYMYKLGYISDGDCSPSGNDPLVKQTLYRHGNFDYITESTIWDPSNPNHNLPNSLYRSNKPSYFGSTPWPAIGPDVQGYVNKIPAEICYESVMAGGNFADCYESEPCQSNSECDNGMYCDGQETCNSGTCQSGTPPCSDDSYSCTTTCDESIDSCNVPNNNVCNDNNDCTTDQCIGAGGNNNGCSFANNANSCDDGIDCTINDVCSSGTCGGTPISGLCSLPSGCVAATCDNLFGCIFQPQGCSNSGNLLLWMKLENPTAVESATELILPTCTNCPSESNEGKDGNSLQFSNNYISLGQPSTLDFNPVTDEFTISAWVKVPSGNQGTIISKTPNWDIDSPEYQFYVYNDRIAANVGGTDVEGNLVVADNNWHHVVLRNYDDQGTKRFMLYVDAVEDSSSGTSGSSNIRNIDVLVGAQRDQDNSDSHFEFNGQIDDLRIHAGDLGVEQIQKLYTKHRSDIKLPYGCVDSTEVVPFIDRWKASNVDVTMKELIESLTIWKNGC